jgi:MATE family multidrug resistance protein
VAQTDSLNKQIFRLGIPNMVASISVPLIGIADTALVGHLSDVAFVGAVSVGSVILDVVFWGLGFLRMGTTALTAQYFGANQRRDCSGVMFLACLIAIVMGVVLVVFRQAIAQLGFFLAGGSADVQFWGRQYTEIRLLGAPLVLLTFVLTGFFRGLGNVLSPMWLTIFVNVVNVVADYALIYGKWGAPELGVLGAAWASVLSAGVGLLYALFVMGKRHRMFLTERPLHFFDRAKLRLLGTTHFYLFGRTACLLFAQFYMLNQVAGMGEVALAANAVLMQLWSLVSYFVDGIAHSAETLIGQAIGGRG